MLSDLYFDMENKNTVNETATISKCRKDKDNTNRELSYKQEKKRLLQYEWQQTDAEVTIIIQFGLAFLLNDLKFNCSDTTINLKLKDFNVWCVELYRPIVPEGISLQTKGSRLLIKVVKRIPNEHWSHLENNEKYQEMEPVQTDKIEERTVVKISSLKYDWYEKGIDTLHLHIYVKNIKKNTLQVIFEETHFVLVFQTRDTSFLKLQGLESEDTICTWELYLKEAVKTDECKYKLSSNNIDVVFKKKKHRKWDVLEAPVQGSSTSVPVNKWEPFPKASSKRQASLILDQAAKQIVHLEKSGRRTLKSEDKNQEKAPLISTGQLLNKSDSLEMRQNKRETNQKPTCIVLPLSKGKLHVQVVIPGLTGLENLGNTCFMNSVLQCLANTREFRDYFLNGLFQAEINTENPLGTGGKLALTYAMLIKVLWSGTHQSYAPIKLKTLIGMNASQFIGFAQHDAQELMTFLLDGLHEDLNRIRKKPYVEIIDYDGRPDEMVADESWKLYKQRNDSIVVDIFQGQYKSKLVCPVCQKVSITFDPFLYLSVPLPKKQRYLTIYFFSKDPYHRPFKYMVSFPQDGKVEELKEKISIKTSVKPSNLRIFEVYKSKIHKVFGKGSSLSAIGSNDIIFAFEVLDEHSLGEPAVELIVIQRMIMPRPVIKCSYCGSECTPGGKLRRCTKCYRAGYCNQGCQKNHWLIHKQDCKEIPELIGLPFLLSLPKSQATFSNLCRMMEAFSRLSVDVFCPPLQLLGIQKTNFQKEPHGINYVSCSSDFKISSEQCFDKSQNSNCNTNVDSSVPCSSSGETLLTSDTSDGNKEIFKNSCSFMCSLRDSGVGNEKEVCRNLKQDGRCNSKTSSTSSASSSTEDVMDNPQQPLLRVVLGHQHENVNFVPPLFLITAANQHGENLKTDKYLKDKGNEPLDLSSYSYLAMDWNNNEKTQNYVLVESKKLECDSEKISESKTTEAMGVTLEQCLQLFTEPEVLSPQEAWYCPHCTEHREATKQLSLWRLPPVLIIQLKRFSFKNLLWREKIDHMVEFPLRNLDLKPYSCGPLSEELPVYDLFAVINHHGGILGGHYTAFARCVDITNSCKSEVDWRLFDDSRVKFVSENRVMTQEAYILFYRQRGVPFSSPCFKDDRVCIKDQKERENFLDINPKNENVLNNIKLQYNLEIDSNILKYATEETDKYSINNEMDMIN